MVLGRVSRRALLVGGWSILGVPVLAACLGRGKKKDGSSGGSGSAGASGGSGQGVTRTVTTVGATLKVTVGPAVVSDDVMVVPLAVHLNKMGSGGLSSDGKKFDVHLAWSGTGNFTGADGARLVDFDAGTVQETFKASSESTGLTKEEPDATLHALFKPVDAKTINVLVPESGLFEGVPVVRDGKLSDEAKKALEDVNKTESSPDPVALETFTASVDGASDTRVTGKSVVINLASDVLFASDSADLSAQADATAYVIDPALVPTRRCPDGVELCGALACGMTIADMRATADDSCTMRVGTDPRTNCFPDLVTSTLAPGRPRPIRCPPPSAPDPHPASLDLRQGDLAPLPFVQPHTSRRTRRTVPCSWPSISWEFSPSSP